MTPRTSESSDEGLWFGEGRLVSVLAMIKFGAQYFYQVGRILTELDSMFTNRKDRVEVMSDNQRDNWLVTMEGFQNHLDEAELSSPSKAVRRTISDLKRGRVKYKDFNCALRSIRSRIEDDIDDLSVWRVPRDKARYLKRDLFGLEAKTRFRESWKDIIEAGKCHAFGRDTASVFHLMRVVEVVLHSLGASLNDESIDPKKNRSWETILRKGDLELAKPLDKRSPEWRTDEQFFSTAQVNLRAVKDAWRNTTMHVDRDYDDEEAVDVYNAVRGFMRQLSKKLGS